MALPTITFNDASGSNPYSASGAGPATALTGTAASYVGSIFTLDGSPDLSGVDTTGLHVIVVATTTGQKWFRITAKDNTLKTVTVHTAPAGTSTGLSWAIGGKVKGLDDTVEALILSTDAESGWTLSLEDNQTIAAVIDYTPTGHATFGGILPIKIVSSTPGTTRTITQSTNAPCIRSNVAAGPLCLVDIKLANSNGTKTDASGIEARGMIILRRCIIGDATNRLLRGITRNGGTVGLCADETRITECTTDGVDLAANAANFTFRNCKIDNNDGHGMEVRSDSTFIVDQCEIHHNGSNGIDLNIFNNGVVTMTSNTIHGNTADGISLVTTFIPATCMIAGNNITGNGGYGIDDNSLADHGALIRANNTGTGGTANTSGATRSLSLDSSNVAVDPQYTDAANGNFTPGSNVRGKGYPPNTETTAGGQGVATNYSHIGSIQPDESAGGGGVNGISVIGGGV